MMNRLSRLNLPLKDLFRYYSVMCKSELMSISENHDSDTKEVLQYDMKIVNDFLNEDEEQSLFNEVEPLLNKRRYEKSHWDNAIHLYREIEKPSWNENNSKIMKRVKFLAFPDEMTLEKNHVLDLKEEGHIKPHIDNIKECGSVIVGLSLLSDCVMRLVHDKKKDKVVDIFLERRSLYIMKNMARYEYTHEILPNSISLFKDKPVKKGRRISILIRCKPELKVTL